MPGLGILTFITLFGSYPLIDSPPGRIHEFGVDAFSPLHANRQLHLTNAHAYFLQKDVESLRLSMKLGATVSHATGRITQLEEDGGLHEQTYDSPAWGLGPSVEAQFSLWNSPGVRVNLGVSAAGMLYDRPFPAGGLRYNGMFQVGPNLEFPIGPRESLTVGVRWLHLSNGHGLTPRNPSFEGRGIVLRYQVPF